MTDQTVAKRPETRSTTLLKMLNTPRMKEALQAVCGKALDPERMINMVYQAATRNQGLLECTPESIAICLLQSTQAGLEIESPLQYSHAVPFKNKHTQKREAKFIIGYRGILYLIRSSDPNVTNIESRIVRKNDKFTLRYGDNQEVSLEPNLDEDGGEVRGAYMMVRYSDGRPPHIEYMNLKQLRAVSNRAASSEGPWKTDEEEMMRKTVLKRGAKPLSLSPIAAQVIAYDNKIETEGMEAADFELVKDPFEKEDEPRKTGTDAARAAVGIPSKTKAKEPEKAAETAPKTPEKEVPATVDNPELVKKFQDEAAALLKTLYPKNTDDFLWNYSGKQWARIEDCATVAELKDMIKVLEREKKEIEERG